MCVVLVVGGIGEEGCGGFERSDFWLVLERTKGRSGDCLEIVRWFLVVVVRGRKKACHGCRDFALPPGGFPDFG